VTAEALSGGSVIADELHHVDASCVVMALLMQPVFHSEGVRRHALHPRPHPRTRDAVRSRHPRNVVNNHPWLYCAVA
jgi:hypothetical protein